MLLPALNQAREKAKTILCINNQRQVWLRINSYLDDNNLYLPLVSQSKFWGRYIAGHNLDFTTSRDKIYFCPSLSVPSNLTHDTAYSYGLCYESYSSDMVLRLDSQNKWILYKKLTRKSRSIPIIVCAGRVDSPYSVFTVEYKSMGSALFTNPHAKRGNVLFSDGHCAPTSPHDWQSHVQYLKRSPILRAYYRDASSYLRLFP